MKNQAVSGLIWCFLERCGAQGVTFVVSIILARLLDPKEYGTIALISVFTAIFSSFVLAGFPTALVQKKNADDIDISSVFYFNVLAGVIFYILFYVFSPYISSFYHDENLIPIIRVYSLTFIIGALKGVQSAYVFKHLLFKRFFWATLVGTICAAFVGVTMAYYGLGVWALIAQSLTNTTIDTIILWLTVKWHPKLIFSFQRLSILFNFGWKLLASGIIDRIYGKLSTLLIAKYYTRSDLAFVHKGYSFPSLVIENINGSINSVLFPSMSKLQDNHEELRDYTRLAMKTSTYLIMPMMALLAVCAESLVCILLTDKWLSSVFYLRIACFTYAFYPVATTNLCAIKALGRSDIFLKLEIMKKIIGLTIIFATIWISIKVFALSAIVSCIIQQLINAYPNRQLINYSCTQQLLDLFPHILLSIIMGIIVYSINILNIHQNIKLCIQIPFGIIIYLVLSYLFHLESFFYVVGRLQSSRFMKKFHI